MRSGFEPEGVRVRRSGDGSATDRIETSEAEGITIADLFRLPSLAASIFDHAVYRLESVFTDPAMLQKFKIHMDRIGKEREARPE